MMQPKRMPQGGCSMTSTCPKKKPARPRSAAPTAPVCHRPAAEEFVDASAWTNRRATEQATRAARARQVSGRRRFVDPATCERDYSPDELEFMRAMHEYKQRSGRMFPSWSEVLEVLQGLGYEKSSRTR